MSPRSLLVLPLLAGLAAAQNSFIVPSALPGPGGLSTAANRGNSQESHTFWYAATPVQPVRNQMLWPVSDVPVPAAAISAMTLRRSNNIGNVNPGGTAALQVDLSVGPNTVAGRSTTFANNLGTSVTTVFNGNVNLPNESNTGPGPATFSVLLPFTTPFTYIAALGNTLVADVTITAYTPTTANASWFVDAVTTDAGLRDTNQLNVNCRWSNGESNRAIGHTNPTLGGNWRVNYQSGSTTRIPTGLPAVGFLSAQGVGSNWNGIPLPIDLGPMGAPGCLWAVAILLTQALTETSAGAGIYTWPLIPVPNDPALYNAQFYDQALWIDPPANALGLVVSWSSRWTVRSGATPDGARIYNYISGGNPTPSPTTGFSTTVTTIAQFHH